MISFYDVPVEVVTQYEGTEHGREMVNTFVVFCYGHISI